MDLIRIKMDVMNGWLCQQDGEYNRNCIKTIQPIEYVTFAQSDTYRDDGDVDECMHGQLRAEFHIVNFLLIKNTIIIHQTQNYLSNDPSLSRTF